MNREIIPYTTEAAWLAERSRDITSTSVSALFGVSPYLTRFELYHRLRGETAIEVEDIGNERTEWGKRLQQAIADGAAAENCWFISEKTEYIRIPDLRIGSSFDYEAGKFEAFPDPSVQWRPSWLVECKNVDSLQFRNGWVATDYGLEAPAHIELQAQHQCLVSGLKRVYIAALIGGNRLVLLEREYDEAIGTRILEECETFWKGPEPAPDFREDAQFISQLYRYAEPGKVINADTRVAELLVEYADTGKQIREFEKHRDSVKAEILTMVGDAERIQFDGGYALAKTQGETVVESFVRKSSRPLRVYGSKS